MTSTLGDAGKKMDSIADAMKPTQPSKFVDTTHQEMLVGFHAQ